MMIRDTDLLEKLRSYTIDGCPGRAGTECVVEKSFLKVVADRMEQLSSENMSVFDLTTTLREHDSVVAVQVWTKDDIVNALNERCCIASPSDSLIYAIAIRAQGRLEDCEHGWDAIYSAIDECVKDERIDTVDESNMSKTQKLKFLCDTTGESLKVCYDALDYSGWELQLASDYIKYGW